MSESGIYYRCKQKGIVTYEDCHACHAEEKLYPTRKQCHDNNLISTHREKENALSQN
jgi:hypothetical protein